MVDKHLTNPVFPMTAIVILLLITFAELVGYAIITAVPLVWLLVAFAAFYLGYHAVFRRDGLPLIFVLLFLSAYLTLFFYLNRDLPIAVSFIIIFAVNSAIMWQLLHHATHLNQEHQTAYSLIAGFMIAQVITLFATTARDWPFRLELASYMPTLFSYIFWRFACLSADALLGWKQFVRIAILVVVLVLAMILGSPNVQV